MSNLEDGYRDVYFYIDKGQVFSAYAEYENTRGKILFQIIPFEIKATRLTDEYYEHTGELHMLNSELVGLIKANG